MVFCKQKIIFDFLLVSVAERSLDRSEIGLSPSSTSPFRSRCRRDLAGAPTSTPTRFVRTRERLDWNKRKTLIYEKHYFIVKTALATFWATLRKFGCLFIPTSGHTASKPPSWIDFNFCLLVDKWHHFW